MATTKKQLPWRCANKQQAKDKAEIYNSREWRELKAMKKKANPVCEMCQAEGRAKGIRFGYLTPTQCVHHIVPIETATTKDEMKRLAFMWSNLQSLCYRHHHQVHNAAGYHTKATVQERKQSALARWIAKHEK